MQSLKLLLVTTQMEAGGAQKALLELAVALRGRGHDVTVWTLYDKADYVREFEMRYGLPIIDLQMKKPGRSTLGQALPFAGGLAHAVRLLRDGQFDVVQSFGHYSNIIMPPLARLAGAPVMITSQRGLLHEAPAWLRQMDRAINNSGLVQMMTAVSEDTRRFCIEGEGIRSEKLLTIHNGIDVARYTPPDGETRRRAFRAEMGLSANQVAVVTVARLSQEKGHRHLIEAMPTILSHAPETRFLFLGEGPSESDLRHQVQAAGLADFVRFLGVRSDIPDVLLGSDIFALPSIWEGLSNAVLEAMAAGLPVVGTAAGGTPELLDDGQAGLLVPPGDAAALARAVVRLISDSNLRRALAAAGQLRAETVFSPERTVQAYEALYLHHLARTHERP